MTEIHEILQGGFPPRRNSSLEEFRQEIHPRRNSSSRNSSRRRSSRRSSSRRSSSRRTPEDRRSPLAPWKASYLFHCAVCHGPRESIAVRVPIKRIVALPFSVSSSAGAKFQIWSSNQREEPQRCKRSASSHRDNIFGTYVSGYCGIVPKIEAFVAT